MCFTLKEALHNLKILKRSISRGLFSTSNWVSKVNLIIEKAIEILKERPLCDRCLGRLFARLGYGWSNKERGDAIKRLIVMEFHRRIQKENEDVKKLFIEIAPNIGYQAQGLYKLLTGKDLKVRSCSICNNVLEEIIEGSVTKAIDLLRAYDIKRFVVGVRLERDIEKIEEDLKRRYGLEFGESIKSEIRREIGKKIQALESSIKVNFEKPEATVLVHFPSGQVDIVINSLLISGKYWKRGRMISQAYWPTPQGPKYYSVEQALWPLLRLTGGERVILHAAGREDIDARMVGTGRPAIVEIKVPRKRNIDFNLARKIILKESKGLIDFEFCGEARRRDISLYKEESKSHKKVYRALIVSEGALDLNDLEKLKEEFNGRMILQRTPSRVLHRRPDILRRKKVYEVSCTLIDKSIMECLIMAEGGLYIKELISGDDGRTTPSFSEVLNKSLTCVELDVLGVEDHELLTFCQTSRG